MNIPRRKPLISLCMIVKNEGDSLSQCLKSVRGVVDEIIVVDTGSTDATVQIALGFGAKVIHHLWSGDFAAARNAGLQQAHGLWILVIDGDEELSEESKGELLLCAEHMEFEAFFLRIHNHKGITPASQTITVNPIIRMFRNRPKYRFSGIIHEQIAEAIITATPQARMHLTTIVIHHYGYAEGVVIKKDKIKRNVELLKEQLRLNPKDPFHHFNMAVEYMRLGEYQPALKHIQQSLEEAPPDTSYIHLLHKYEIRSLAELKDFPGALAACDRGISSHPDYPDLAHNKGVLLFQLGAFANAKVALLQALVIGAAPPGYHTEAGFGSYLTYYVLGQLCEETGDETEAIACYTKTAQLHPEPTPVIARLLRVLKCAGREREIYGWFHSHLPDYTVTKNRILQELLHNEGCNEAIAQLINAMEQPISKEVALNQASQQGRSQILLADRLLATLSSSATYSPAVKRARLALPLPNVSE
ncbi:glycosyltransferase [Paenibacillus sp. FSL R10-2734]|uniref:tetratricopeptide repeat-containing glycosyltransferase family 2 protein n=1 Tax=Paenibacillus sp. FSL R10-2734 TaxID=2954691 RepID=UPI0030DDBE63